MDIGTQIGPYQVNGLIGRGGMAEVYKAWNVDLHREEALKVLPPQMTFDPSFVERFLKEARTAASLRHAHIATIYMVSPVTESRPYFAMELVQGGDLAGLLHRQGSLPLGSALPLLRQIAGALDYAHRQGIVHRDVKPANILLEDDGHGGWNVKVVDFGIARAQEAGDGARLTKTGMIVGTPEYMSPEQGGSGEKVDHRSDQYSLGAVAYEMLCGRPPFAVGPDGTAMTVIMSHIRDTPHAPVDYVPGLIPSANNAVLSALSKKPEDRFTSCAEFVAALESRIPGEITAASVPQPPLQRRPTQVVPLLIGGAFILGAGLIGFGINRSGSRQPVPAVGSVSPLPSSFVPATSGITVLSTYKFNDCQATASTELKGGQGYAYSPSLVLDGRHDTAWNVKNHEHGIGEWIKISWPGDRRVTKIGVVVGYDKINLKPQYHDQPDMWYRNDRLKSATLLFPDGNQYHVNFLDTKQVQYKEINEPHAQWMKLKIDDIYLDMYGGKVSRWDDLAISEIEIWGK